MEENKITARFILDILGAPAEYIESKLREHIDKVRTDENCNIITERIAEPQQKDQLFTTFAELEIEFRDPASLLNFCFDSMPSSVELLEPERITLSMQDFNDLLNDFQNKLHHTDSMISRLHAEKRHLDINTMNVFRNFIKFALEQKPQTEKELSTIVGVPAEGLQPFLKKIEESGKIQKEGEKWTLKERSKQSSSHQQND